MALPILLLLLQNALLTSYTSSYWRGELVEQADKIPQKLMLRRWAICVWCDFTQIIKGKEESKKLIKDQGVYNFIILFLLVPDTMMKYIRGWLQMVYRHMIYSPEIDKQAWQRDHGTWWLDNIDNICMYGRRTFAKNIK
jgi:hypothetical protein